MSWTPTRRPQYRDCWPAAAAITGALLDWSGDDKRVLLGREQGTEDAVATWAVRARPTHSSTSPRWTAARSRRSARAAATTAKCQRSGSKGNPPRRTAVQVRDARFATDGHGIVMLTQQPTRAGAGGERCLDRCDWPIWICTTSSGTT